MKKEAKLFVEPLLTLKYLLISRPCADFPSKEVPNQNKSRWIKNRDHPIRMPPIKQPDFKSQLLLFHIYIFVTSI
jgi:hypothetical protein